MIAIFEYVKNKIRDLQYKNVNNRFTTQVLKELNCSNAVYEINTDENVGKILREDKLAVIILRVRVSLYIKTTLRTHISWNDISFTNVTIS